jgi:formylglycine-generating enzyme required for sulfatase activity
MALEPENRPQDIPTWISLLATTSKVVTLHNSETDNNTQQSPQPQPVNNQPPKPQPPPPPKVRTQPPSPPKPQPQPQLQPTSRRGFIQTAGLFAGGVIVTVVGQNLLGNKNQTSTQTSTSKNPTSANTPTAKNTTSRKQTPTQTNTTFANNLKTFNFEVITTDASGNIIKRRNNSARYFEEDLGNGVILEMVEIPGGTFIMGSPASEKGRSSDESPQHQVTVPSFYMGKYELTQKQYQAIFGKNPSMFKGENLPVENVSWDDAVTFCQRLSQKTGKNYRLPSEAEWEYACRAGTTTPFYFGESITPDLVNYDGNYSYASAPKGKYRGQTTDVGTFPPNAFGLYDMHGNVWEWCLDDYQDNYNNAPKNSSASTSQSKRTKIIRKVNRGGVWNYNTEVCRSASRSNYVWTERDNFFYNVGFRVVCAVGSTN